MLSTKNRIFSHFIVLLLLQLGIQIALNIDWVNQRIYGLRIYNHRILGRQKIEGILIWGQWWAILFCWWNLKVCKTKKENFTGLLPIMRCIFLQWRWVVKKLSIYLRFSICITTIQVWQKRLSVPKRKKSTIEHSTTLAIKNLTAVYHYNSYRWTDIWEKVYDHYI